ncbi:MAG TPA: L-fucose/L-arabinose isomerase family protein [Phycisphaerae bacterium]|nr:L-fucose/L-arabinose isomerase family protein [Phycisphaerae bacterium]HOJ74740.1 L-fucose/L-arabinose isomerase family protein [Phycisphaerae bacterium]HOM52109.1 L-fucose/L-arabinose isomerase family protein [Phycisphaerae bacterium]HOQ87236.1 L-fucose/L-arabinose isomerase family protein [Phycisphaerae bacterium]HPP27636.1 L-fucose/L-arabinose isomerase family protein [Phycisphaerae bacterium]
MLDARKPRIGLLGIMQELYDNFLPGITARQEEYARAVAAQLANVVDVDFPGAARNRADIEARVRHFNQEGLDGILIMMLTYGPALRTVQALRENNLPIMLANIQPERNVTAKWDMADLTYNQGIHGAQDTANAIMRSRIPCPIITEDWRSDAFRLFVQDWAHAAQTCQRLRRMRIATIGQMPGMGDILTDSAQFMRKIGPQIDHVSLGTVQRLCEAASDADVKAAMDEDRRNFEIDPKLSEENHRYAARFQVGIQALLEQGGYDGFSIYFGAVADDGRFRQLHMLAASNLLAKGYGYAAEGDTTCCSLVAAGHSIAPDAHFTEMYAMDFDLDSALMSHMGEGNWKIARKDRPIRLIDRPLGIGALDNPPTVLFQAAPGEATLTDLLATNDGSYRLLVAKGTILDTPELPHVEMPYFHFRPDTGIKACMDSWLRLGGTHHQCLHLGNQVRRWQMLCELLGIECVLV